MFIERLKKARNEKNISQKELALQLHISQQAYAKYETGKSSPNPETLAAICRCLHVAPDYLLNIDSKEYKHPKQCSQVHRLSLPIFEKENASSIDYITDISKYFKGFFSIEEKTPDFCFPVSNNSMIGAGIQAGDVVFVRKQDKVENGEIALVFSNQELSLKRVYYDHEEMKLFPENYNDRPMYYRKEEFNQFQILGKAISVYSDLKRNS